MNNIFIIIILSIFIALLVYRLLTYLYCQRLKKDLKDADLKLFIFRLGNNYQYKHISKEKTRYKWAKGWVTIRANFDNKGQAEKNYMGTSNFTFTKANIWFNKDKAILFQKVSYALLFAAIIYMVMSVVVMFFPHIMDGLSNIVIRFYKLLTGDSANS